MVFMMSVGFLNYVGLKLLDVFLIQELDNLAQE